MATLEDLAYVRDYVGTDEPTDGEIFEAIDETGSWARAARRILQRRKADLLNGPASFSVPGYSENNGEVIKAITANLQALEDIIAGVSDDEAALVTTTTLYRPGRCRR